LWRDGTPSIYVHAFILRVGARVSRPLVCLVDRDTLCVQSVMRNRFVYCKQLLFVSLQFRWHNADPQAARSLTLYETRTPVKDHYNQLNGTNTYLIVSYLGAIFARPLRKVLKITD